MKTEKQKPGYGTSHTQLYDRRSIPIEYEDYIAQTLGYDNLMRVPKSQFKKVKAVIKERFVQTGATIRKPYGRKSQIILRGDDETELDFAKRIDAARYGEDFTSVQEYDVTFTPGTVPGDTMISRDAETLSLSDLNPETVKQVAAELLELEKRKNAISPELLLKIIATLNKFEGILIAKRFGQSILEAIPKKHAFPKGGIVHETGPELIGIPGDVKRWAHPGNTQQIRKPYAGMDFARLGSDRAVLTATSNDGLIWFDEIKIRNYTPDNWPASAPPYFSAEGWEFEKSMKLRNLKSMLTIEWLEKQQTEKHALVAQRLREILAA